MAGMLLKNYATEEFSAGLFLYLPRLDDSTGNKTTNRVKTNTVKPNAVFLMKRRDGGEKGLVKVT